jgi:hypothetical protein
MNVLKFAHHARIVQHISQGNDSMLLGKMFRHVGIQYEASFDKAIHIGRTLCTTNNVVIGTKFDIIDKNTFERRPHFVTLWFDRQGKGFLLDTMGEITGKGGVHMNVYKDYPIVREVLGLDTTRGEGIHSALLGTSADSMFQQLHVVEKNWRFRAMEDMSVENIARHHEWSPDVDIAHFSASILERTFPDA